ncbi:MAG TPA: hypothetical protein VJ775_01320 [Sphingomicrobium sp.]|nr:hypothetical protein [Sphingomicrobium sp.]
MRFRNAFFAAALAWSSAGQAAWHEAKSSHFVIYADEKPEALRAFAAKLEKYDQAVRIVRGMDDPPLGDAGRVTVYVLPNATAVSKLMTGEKTSIAGFYVPSVRGSVAYVPDFTGAEADEAARTFFHEYAHHLMLQTIGMALPAWYVEGFAEFFSTAEFPRDGMVELGQAAEHRAYGLFQLKKPPIEELLKSSFEDRDDLLMEVMYSRSWLLTHYLTNDEGRTGQTVRYLEAIQKGRDPVEAARAAFGDLKQLDRDLDAYLRRNKFPYLKVNSPRLNAGPVPIRPLSPGEAASIPFRERLGKGLKADKDAQGVAAGARTLAAKFASDPSVHATIALIELELDKFEAADAAADKALALNPRYVPALIAKGRAQMELESANPNWASIRSWFTKANAIDPENPEPLMLYYQSFQYSGERPTKNAVDGLLYAVELAPQDPNLRLMAATQLLNDKKPAEARRMLATLAYSPHSGGGREFARKLINSIDRGDADPLRAMSETEAGKAGQ